VKAAASEVEKEQAVAAGGERPSSSTRKQPAYHASDLRAGRPPMLTVFHVIRRWFIRRFRHPLGWIDEKVLAKTAERILQEQCSRGRELDADHLTYALSAAYNMDVIDREWARQVFSPGETSVPKRLRAARRFARAEAPGDEDNYRHQARVLRTAEALFNLRHVDGIRGLLKALRDGRVEPTLAELEAGSFLARRGISFRYVTPRGSKGEDYDILIPLEEAGPVPCEVECRIEGGELTRRGIGSTLHHARKQLPRGKRGLVFLRIPEEWVLTPEVARVLPQAIGDVFRNTERIVAVVVRWEETYLGVPKGGATVTRYRVEVNERLAIATPVRGLLERLSGAQTGYWVSFRQIAETVAAQP
jgi:hypothetical protein